MSHPPPGPREEKLILPPPHPRPGNFAWDGFLLGMPRGKQELGSGSGQRPKAGGRGSCSGTPPHPHSSWDTPAIGTPKKETGIGKSLGVRRARSRDRRGPRDTNFKGGKKPTLGGAGAGRKGEGPEREREKTESFSGLESGVLEEK